jgi:hypothetical protein
MERLDINDSMIMNDIIMPLISYSRSSSVSFQDKFMRDLVFNLLKEQFNGNPTDMLIFIGRLMIIIENYNHEYIRQEINNSS